MALPPDFPRLFLRLWHKRWAFLDHAQGFGDGAVELGIDVVGEVLRRDIDLDVGIGAVVFDVPADIFEPEGIFWLRGARAIDQRVCVTDADDAAPGARADQGTGPSV